MASKTIKAMCLTCNKQMDMKVFWKKYCSSQCRLIAWAKRKLDEAKEQGK